MKSPIGSSITLLALAIIVASVGCNHDTYKVVSFTQSHVPYDVPYWGCRIVVAKGEARVHAQSGYDCGNLELGMPADVIGDEVLITGGGHFWVTKGETVR